MEYGICNFDNRHDLCQIAAKSFNNQFYPSTRRKPLPYPKSLVTFSHIPAGATSGHGVQYWQVGLNSYHQIMLENSG